MSNVKESDIVNLLESWAEDKAELAIIEKRIEKYKKLATRIMDNTGTNNISSSNYTLRRSNMSRTTITKQDVPTQIWEKYARTCSYPAYYLSVKK